MFEVPILLITFNRPEHTKRVWEEIKKQKPKQIFVFQDGARNDGDKVNINAVRALFVEPLDWNGELHTNFSDVNLGCGKGPSTAISWFFEHVEEGIIFEDDCVPHPDFFEYCKALLEKYRANPSVAFIGGTNFQDGMVRGDASYYFSAGHHGTWGWATWKRTWNDFDYYLNGVDAKSIKPMINKYFSNGIQRNYWMEIFEMVKDNRCRESCWDYQFYFSCWKHQMMAIIPNVNLVSNIGFDDSATHTLDNSNKLSNQSTESIFPLTHPKRIDQDKKADFYLHKTYIQPYEYGWSGLKRWPYRINKKIKKLVGHRGKWIK